jgi:hypothetical protein
LQKAFASPDVLAAVELLLLGDHSPPAPGRQPPSVQHQLRLDRRDTHVLLQKLQERECLHRLSDAALRSLIGRSGETDRLLLVAALQQPDPALLSRLCELGVNVSARAAGARFSSQTTALHIGAGLGRAAHCAVLLAHGAAVDACDANAETPLSHAASAGKPDVVRLLAAAGADPLHRDCWGFTPLGRARVYADREAHASGTCLAALVREAVRRALAPVASGAAACGSGSGDACVAAARKACTVPAAPDAHAAARSCSRAPGGCLHALGTTRSGGSSVATAARPLSLSLGSCETESIGTAGSGGSLRSAQRLPPSRCSSPRSLISVTPAGAALLERGHGHAGPAGCAARVAGAPAPADAAHPSLLAVGRAGAPSAASPHRAMRLAAALIDSRQQHHSLFGAACSADGKAVSARSATLPPLTGDAALASVHLPATVLRGLPGAAGAASAGRLLTVPPYVASFLLVQQALVQGCREYAWRRRAAVACKRAGSCGWGGKAT